MFEKHRKVLSSVSDLKGAPWLLSGDRWWKGKTRAEGPILEKAPQNPRMHHTAAVLS